MNLTIEVPEELEAALKAKAMAQGVSLRALQGRCFENAVKAEGQPLKPKKSGYGLLAKYGPARPRKRSTKTGGRCSADSPRTFRDRWRCRYPRGALVLAQEPPSLCDGAQFHG